MMTMMIATTIAMMGRLMKNRYMEGILDYTVKLNGSAEIWFRCSGFGFQYCACPVHVPHGGASEPSPDREGGGL